METYGLSSVHGNLITEGYQATHQQALAMAQRWANELGEPVDLWTAEAVARGEDDTEIVCPESSSS